MYANLIKASALRYNLREDIIAAIILQESGGDPEAVRFEPKIYELTKVKKTATRNVTGDTEAVLRAMSWGLMQPLGETTRWCAKYQGPLVMLTHPDVNIDVGCAILSHYLDKSDGDYEQALCRYNAGSPTSEQGKKYAKQVLNRISNNEHLKLLQKDWIRI